MKKNKTERGFFIYEFKDQKGNKCSLQKSSLADESCIWLGLSEPIIKEFYPFPRATNQSWFDITQEKLNTLKSRPQNEIHTFSRMHLNRKQVKKLIKILSTLLEENEL